MQIKRHFTKKNESPYAAITFRAASSEIRNPDGSIVYRNDRVEVPSAFSQVATDIIAQKYFRKAGVPARLRRVPEEGVPNWLWRSEPDLEALQAPQLQAAAGPLLASAGLGPEELARTRAELKASMEEADTGFIEADAFGGKPGLQRALFNADGQTFDSLLTALSSN